MYVGFSNIISMNSFEEKSLALLSKVELRDEIVVLAQKILNKAAIQKIRSHNTNNPHKDRRNYDEKMEQLVDEFRQKRR